MSAFLVLPFNIPNLAQADNSYDPGQWFNHSYYIINESSSCTLTVTKAYKSWESTNGKLVQVDYISGTSEKQSSSGEVVWEGLYTVEPNTTGEVPFVLNFLTHEDTVDDKITSEFQYESYFSSDCIDKGGQTEASLISYVKSYCGDGKIHDPNGYDETEECDDGNITSGDGCSATCQTESSGGSSGGGGGSSDGGSGGGSSDGGSGGGSSDDGSGGGSDDDDPDGELSPSNIDSTESTGGEPCEFESSFRESLINLNGEIPLLTPVNGEVRIPLSEFENSPDCSVAEKVCLEIAARAIVGGKRTTDDMREVTTWSDCLPTSDFRIENDEVIIPAQMNIIGKVHAGTFLAETNTPSVFGSPAYFETRLIDRVDVTGMIGTDDYYQEARNALAPNLANLLQPFYEQCGGEICGCDASPPGVTLTSLDVYGGATFTDREGKSRPLTDCARDNVIFFDPSGGSVTLDAPGDTFELPDYPVTLVVKGADVLIADDLQYSSGDNGSLLGIITLFNGIYSGNLQIYPNVKNLVGAYFLEGTLQAVDHAWQIPDKRNDTDYYEIFKNQLFLKGTIISQNTIERTDDPTWPNYDLQSQCNSNFELVSCPWEEAVRVDLAFLREYFPCGNSSAAVSNYGSENWQIPNCNSATDQAYNGQAAPESNSSAPIVIRYDSRIQTNPPPGFESLSENWQNTSTWQ